TNSIENIRFSRRFLPENSAVILITDAYHAPRARLIARRLGLRATSASPRLGQVPRARLLKAWAREAAAYAWTALTLWR
ncbi:MAG TPA: YdcF family protein, partial [Aliiroseovarius sp.]|nr:YdcF family protein [Aliiroseovarius sp.]